MITGRSTADILPALGKHVQPFTDDNGNFSPTTVGNGLQQMHGSQTCAKGTVISTFNATHASDNIVCPVTGARFVADPQTGYAKNLHLGTTRVWNANGGINEERWDMLVEYVTAGQSSENKIMTLSKLKAYLLKCYNDDPHELTTGRNNNSLFSSKIVQGFAATAAWDEVYDRLTCGWAQVDDKPTELEPYITLDIVRLFFEDSKKAFQLAECGKLPVKKPELEVEEKQVSTLGMS